MEEVAVAHTHKVNERPIKRDYKKEERERERRE